MSRTGDEARAAVSAWKTSALLRSSFSPTWSLRKANGLQSESRDLEWGCRQPRGKKNAAGFNMQTRKSGKKNTEKKGSARAKKKNESRGRNRDISHEWLLAQHTFEGGRKTFNIHGLKLSRNVISNNNQQTSCFLHFVIGIWSLWIGIRW